MWLIDQIVEERVKQAQAAGEFDNLPGRGEPQVLDDDSMIPESLRVGYRILKNHGLIPQELQWQQEIQSLEALLRRIEHGEVNPEQLETGGQTSLADGADVRSAREESRADDPQLQKIRKRLHLLQIQVGLERSRRTR